LSGKSFRRGHRETGLSYPQDLAAGGRKSVQVQAADGRLW